MFYSCTRSWERLSIETYASLDGHVPVVAGFHLKVKYFFYAKSEKLFVDQTFLTASYLHGMIKLLCRATCIRMAMCTVYTLESLSSHQLGIAASSYFYVTTKAASSQ